MVSAAPVCVRLSTSRQRRPDLSTAQRTLALRLSPEPRHEKMPRRLRRRRFTTRSPARLEDTQGGTIMTRVQPLIRSLGIDGAEYLLVIESCERWTIQRSGAMIADG